jgi:uncharacterized protein (TIGR03000 family)
MKRLPIGCIALALLAAVPAQGRAQAFYGSSTGGFGAAPGNLSGYSGGYGSGYGAGYGMGASTRSAPSWAGGAYGYSGYSGYAPSYSGYAPSYAGGYRPLAPTFPARSLTNLPAAPPRPAYIVVRVPAGARVLVDGRPTRQNGPRRTFRSPPLEPGEQYYYEVTVRRPGQAGQTRRVVVQAGGRVTVDFTRSGS